MKSVKAFFLGIGCALLSVLSFILGKKIFRNGESASEPGRNISDAEREAVGTGRAISESKQINRELTESSERGAEILREIRKQKLQG